MEQGRSEPTFVPDAICRQCALGLDAGKLLSRQIEMQIVETRAQ